ncbi:hypothetical protein [Nocardioides speluncae]|uniref:hypothetical protein n=1 Tax=Nocardioides speluncae TaxID=2670337 RepID=UPI000D699BA6|nr:hypothetical protein [Nocardioides speluncae]
MSRALRGRLLILFALVALVLGLSQLRDDGTAAQAAQPPCGPNDANRQTLNLYDGSQVRPCLSGAVLQLNIVRGLFQTPFRVNKIRFVEGPVTLTMADGSTRSNLYHITFESFLIDDRASLLVDAPNYDLSLAPDASSTIGGSGVNIDLWVTGSSRLEVRVLFCFGFSIDGLSGLSNILNGTSWDGCSLDFDIVFATLYRPAGSSTGTFPLRMPDTTIEVR